MSLRGELEQIYRERGMLSPALLVATAQDETHPLHNRFEWDDGAAAARFREVQAAELIRSVRIVYAEDRRGNKKSVRRFVAPRSDVQPNAYIPTEEALQDEFIRQLILRQFERDILALKRRYSHLKEYDDMVRAHGLTGDAA